MYIFGQLPPPVTSLNVVGVVGPWIGVREMMISDFKRIDVIATHHGIQSRLSNIPLTREQPYYALPENYHGNQLKSYGGYFRYDIQYDGDGSAIASPDIIMTVSENALPLIHL